MILEDEPNDAELMGLELARAGMRFLIERVESEHEFLRQLRDFAPDLVLADYCLPGYDGLAALAATRQERPGTPFIFISGAIEEESLIEALHRGATDYVCKQRLSRLGPAVERALREAQNEQERRRAEQEVHESEEQYRQLVELSPDAIFIHVGGRITFINSAGLKLLGASQAEQVLGKTVLELLHPDFRAAVAQRIARVHHQRVAAPWMEQIYLRLDGSPVEVEAAATPLTVPGQPAVQVILRDITGRKRLEALLRQAQKMEALGQLAGGVAHDFNNLLAAMLLHLSLLQQEPSLTPDLKCSLREMENGVHRGARLTRQLLTFSRRQVPRIEPLDLNQLVSDLAKMLRRLLGENIELVLQLAPAPLWLEADAGMLEQVVMNLAVNARDARPKSGKVIIVTRRAQSKVQASPAQAGLIPGTFACLEVIDDGCGMDAATLERIFEPFFTTKEAGQGTGLGLATVHGIVKQHQGWLEVDSQPNQGSTFRAFFPALDQAPSAAAQADSCEAIRGGNETILVVEDDPALRRLAARDLRRLGYQVLEAATGPQALELWARHQGQVDLLLTDMMMPGALTGVDLIGRLLQAKPGLKAILSSGYSLEAARLNHESNPNITYLPKPYREDTLAATVRRCLEQK